MSKRNTTELAYLRSAVQNASAVGLVVILYDLLISDLERAIAAMATGEIEKRTTEIKHAFLVLQQLEGSLQMEAGGEAAKNLSNFYAALRCKILEAQIKVSPEILKRQIELILSVRKAWQEVDPSGPSVPTSVSQAPAHSDGHKPRAAAAAAGAGTETRGTNWTA